MSGGRLDAEDNVRIVVDEMLLGKRVLLLELIVSSVALML